jgi:hypothetical protein
MHAPKQPFLKIYGTTGTMRISNAYLNLNPFDYECHLDINNWIMLYYFLHAHANTNINKRKGQT